mmetsp:Transcript_37955/g.74665  ORF Transcript_37955/g.74665 Transcript_37955/m.74665 type:complete len:269 (+) Transcript_37955:339-1145(+)
MSSLCGAECSCPATPPLFQQARSDPCKIAHSGSWNSRLPLGGDQSTSHARALQTPPRDSAFLCRCSLASFSRPSNPCELQNKKHWATPRSPVAAQCDRISRSACHDPHSTRKQPTHCSWVSSVCADQSDIGVPNPCLQKNGAFIVIAWPSAIILSDIYHGSQILIAAEHAVSQSRALILQGLTEFSPRIQSHVLADVVQFCDDVAWRTSCQLFYFFLRSCFISEFGPPTALAFVALWLFEKNSRPETQLSDGGGVVRHTQNVVYSRLH